MGDASYTRHCAAIEAEVTRIIELVASAEPATPVPTCPGWTIADLIKHHGTTHRWMTHLMRTGATERVWSRDVPLDLPPDARDYPAWLAASAATSSATLRAADPDAPIWSHGVDQHVRFWPRRLLAEAIVHRADAELALGGEPTVDAALAVDVLDECLENLLCYSWVAQRVGALGRDGASVHLHATDIDGEWMITLGGGGFTWTRGHGKGSVAVRGAASDLLLLAYGRLSADDQRCTVFGDQELLTSWLTATAL